MKTLAPATLAGASTPTRITAGESSPTAVVLASMVIIQVDIANTDTVYIGDANVDEATKRGIVLGVGVADETAPSIVLQDPAGANRINLADIWFDSTSAAQIVNVFYLDE